MKRASPGPIQERLTKEKYSHPTQPRKPQEKVWLIIFMVMLLCHLKQLDGTFSLCLPRVEFPRWRVKHAGDPRRAKTCGRSLSALRARRPVGCTSVGWSHRLCANSTLRGRCKFPLGHRCRFRWQVFPLDGSIVGLYPHRP